MKKQIYKAESYLYCVKPVVMENGINQGKSVTRLNKNYKINFIIDKKFYITDETGRSHSFDFCGYTKWFIYTDVEIKGINKLVDEIIDNDNFWL